METEETKPSMGKKLLKIILAVFVVFILLAITAFILTERKDANEAQQIETSISTQTKTETFEAPRPLTVEEKQQIEERISGPITTLLTQKEKEGLLQMTKDGTATTLTPEEKTAIEQRMTL